MLRPILRSAGASRLQSRANLGPGGARGNIMTRLMGTQSGDDAKKPTALAKLHLEDGTTILGKSFGSHESVEGEVRY